MCRPGRPAAITWAREESCCPEPQNEYTQQQGRRTLTVQWVLGTEMMLIMTKTIICANRHLRPRTFQPRLFTDGNPKEPSERSTSIPILVAKGKLRDSPEVPKQAWPEEPALLRAPSCPWPPPAPAVCAFLQRMTVTTERPGWLRFAGCRQTVCTFHVCHM